MAVDVCNKVSEGCKLLGGIKKVLKCRRLEINVKRELYKSFCSNSDVWIENISHESHEENGRCN